MVHDAAVLAGYRQRAAGDAEKAEIPLGLSGELFQKVLVHAVDDPTAGQRLPQLLRGEGGAISHRGKEEQPRGHTVAGEVEEDPLVQISAGVRSAAGEEPLDPLGGEPGQGDDEGRVLPGERMLREYGISALTTEQVQAQRNPGTGGGEPQIPEGADGMLRREGDLMSGTGSRVVCVGSLRLTARRLVVGAPCLREVGHVMPPFPTLSVIVL